MKDLSLNVLDIANNSIKARAKLIKIYLLIHKKDNKTTLIIEDNGCGMDDKQIAMAHDPFYSTKKPELIGLGIPFFSQSALDTGGNFKIESITNKGTVVTATFNTWHIDCPPLGDMGSTIYALITANTNLDFLYYCKIDDSFKFTLDTRILRATLQDIPLNAPGVSAFIRKELNKTQNKIEEEVR